MDLKELDKKQLILLTLLITFIVSIATGIITVSLMQQAPQSVPQTINNVIQRTIEKVTTVEVPSKTTPNTKVDSSNQEDKEVSVLGDGKVMVSIYKVDSTPVIPDVGEVNTNPNTDINNQEVPVDSSFLGQGIIISEVGLILVDSSILNSGELYKVVLNDIDFDATILKKFNNGFTILRISSKNLTPTTNTEESKDSSGGN